MTDSHNHHSYPGPRKLNKLSRSTVVGSPPRASSWRVSQIMRSNRSSGTTPELILARFLRRRLVKSKLLGHPDFVFVKARAAVFVQGCWWHQCPTCKIGIPRTHRSYWGRKLRRNVERDHMVKSELEAKGWKVVEIWEHELKQNPRAAASKVRCALSR